MEEIFEPRPSTSSEDIQLNRDSSIRPAKDPELGPRKLSIVPRIAQYERHPLLQERSPSGISQLEELTNMLQRQKSFDVGDSFPECFETVPEINNKTKNNNISPSSQINNTTALDKTNINQKTQNSPLEEMDKLDKKVENIANRDTHTKLRRLVPRGALCERHPLLEKSESGMSELEMYLIEKEQELLLNSNNKDDSVQNNFKTINENDGAAQTRRRQLQPRQNQYEKHALLESRDEQGLSPLDHFLHEKERLVQERLLSEGAVIDQEEDSTGSKGKCSEKCVCKNATCVICKPNHQTNSPMTNHTDKSTANVQSSQVLNSGQVESKSDDSLNVDIKAPLINHRDELHEVIDLRRNTNLLNEENTTYEENIEGLCDGQTEVTDEQYENQCEDDFDDLMRSHPPLMKKESSRETMIEPKETNKRVHFERTSSEKERDMKACTTGLTLDSQGQPIITQNQSDTRSQSDNDVKKKKRRFWPWWGGSNRLCQRNEGSPDCGRVGRTNETIPLVEDASNPQKDQNENNKKSHNKPCIIL